MESITAYGQYWNFVGEDAWSVAPHGVLSDVPRYAPICALAPAGTPCTFDSRTFVMLNGELVESITAYGMYWNLADDAPWPVAPNGRLERVTRYQGIHP